LRATEEYHIILQAAMFWRKFHRCKSGVSVVHRALS